MKLRYRIAVRVIYMVWKVLFGLKISGQENIPKKGGVIIAPNHLSNFDPPLVGVAVWFRECYFFSKKDIFVINKFYSWIMAQFNALPVTSEKPEKKALTYFCNLLNNGLAIVFFPEGTRSKAGHILNFNSGVGWLAMKCKVPIIPVLIKNTNTSLLKQFLRKTRVYIKFGNPITKEEICAIGIGKEARESIVKELRVRLENLRLSVERGFIPRILRRFED